MPQIQAQTQLQAAAESGSLLVVTGAVADCILADNRDEILRIVSETYLAHRAGSTVNPESQFLRFPDRPDARFIALPASISFGYVRSAGIKWIGSFPANVTVGRPRASAVLLLNDLDTGQPLACLEAAGISAARTAASAALGARALQVDSTRSIGVVGAGVIAATVIDYLDTAGALGGSAVVHDRDSSSATALCRVLDRHGVASITGTLNEALDGDLVLFATTATAPYVDPTFRFRPGQIVLHLSLRDLDPAQLLAAANIVDDVQHCLRAGTTPHLAQQQLGHHDFIDGTLGDVLAGELHLGANRPVIFSPFGLGVLDLGVARWMLDRAVEAGEVIVVPQFIARQSRW